jgi:tocopherol cyclase
MRYFWIFLIIQFSFLNLINAQGRFRHFASNGPALYDLRKIYNPSWFQGNLQRNNYYEGWYFKIVSEDNSRSFAFIPGISLGNDSHSFIQVIDGNTGDTQYHRFPVDSFSYSRRMFSVLISGNNFSEGGFAINLDDDRMQGEIHFEGITPFPVSLLSPGIMGWYRYVPFMETYHGVVSLHHRLYGYIVTDGDTISFDNGRGYVEKDWGSSMPRAWIWMQSNSFMQQQDVSFMISVAHIPWLGSSFTGFLGYLMWDDKLWPFATYTGAKLQTVAVGQDDVDIIISDRNYRIIIKGNKGLRGTLLAPVAGNMTRTIHESLDAMITIRLEDKNGNKVFEAKTARAGLELVGDHQLLQP